MQIADWEFVLAKVLFWKRLLCRHGPPLANELIFLSLVHQAVVESSFCLVNPLSLYFSNFPLRSKFAAERGVKPIEIFIRNWRVRVKALTRKCPEVSHKEYESYSSPTRTSFEISYFFSVWLPATRLAARAWDNISRSRSDWDRSNFTWFSCFSTLISSAWTLPSWFACWR